MIDTWLQIATSLVIGAIAAILADWRGRSTSIWFVIGMLFGPFGLITLLLLPSRAENAETDTSTGRFVKEKQEKSRWSTSIFESKDLSNASNKGNPEELNKDSPISTSSEGALQFKEEDITAQKWYYIIKGMKKAEGPVSLDAISELWGSGELGDDTFVWCSHFNEWTKISQAEVLKNYLQKAVRAD